MVKKCNDETEWKYIPTDTMEDTFSATGFTCNILYYGNHVNNKIKLVLNDFLTFLKKIIESNCY